MTGIYDKLTKVDIRRNREAHRQAVILANLQLMTAQVSLIQFLEKKYGAKNYSEWLSFCRKVDGKYPLLVQNEAVKTIREQLELVTNIFR